MSKTQKYYVVWQGIKPGIYSNWADCLAQVNAFPNAKYKAFPSKIEAEQAYYKGYENSINRSEKKPVYTANWKSKIPEGSIAVDAACSGNPGKLEYRGVDLHSKDEIFCIGPLEEGTNNIGEFLAIVHALALLKRKNDNTTIIYSDSRTAIGWVKKKQPNTKLVFTERNKKLKDLLTRAVEWLRDNSFQNKIIKWETEIWGENPADFGRK